MILLFSFSDKTHRLWVFCYGRKSILQN